MGWALQAFTVHRTFQGPGQKLPTPRSTPPTPLTDFLSRMPGLLAGSVSKALRESMLVAHTFWKLNAQFLLQVSRKERALARCRYPP